MNKGKTMKASLLFLPSLIASGIINGCLPGGDSDNSLKPAIPYCKTWECDSMVVRALLDSNGQSDGRIDKGDGDRITWLSLARIHKVPPEIGRLDDLEYLALAGDFSEVPVSMGQLRSLGYLELESDGLADIGDWLGNLPFLETLIIRSSSLTKLPNSAAKLKYLSRLDLADNQLDSLPQGIAGFVALEELILNNNRFQTLPSVIGNCTRLTRLELNDNRLKSLPATIGKLTELMFLLLRENPIKEFPEEITNLKKIENMDMYGLRICEPSPTVWNWLDSVNEGWERQIAAFDCAGF
jgi:Leucine-rich repeat (LRR) protein